jgi:DNA (cytosine-5)-methyltransferase 1
VPFLLQLEHGRALELITGELSRLGYAWAYRVIDAKAFGIPQRRRRWYLVASLSGDPRDVLLAGSADPRTPASNKAACGFYWTEGTRALGWAVDAIPPLKGGSSVGVPSPPAIVFPDGRFVTPDIRDAERLQGFPANWTLPAEAVAKPGYRWLLVGNAVAVRVAAWLGCRLTRPGRYEAQEDALWDGDRWPDAAWALPGESMYVSQASSWPVARPSIHLADFLRYPTRPLSERAALGFLRRADGAKLRFPPGLLDALRQHIASSARAA